MSAQKRLVNFRHSITSGNSRANVCRQIEPAEGAAVIKHRLKVEALRAATGFSAFGGLLNYFSGNLTRRTLLFVLIPLIFLSYFGMLTSAIFLSPIAYDWRYSVISHLISPRNNPEFHTVPSLGIAITGLLIIPFAGYINRRFAWCFEARREYRNCCLCKRSNLVSTCRSHRVSESSWNLESSETP